MKKKNKSCSFDGKPVFDIQSELVIPIRYSNRASLVMHTELGAGKHKRKSFRLIQDIGNRGFRLEYNDEHLDLDTSALVTAMMNKIQSLRKERK